MDNSWCCVPQCNSSGNDIPKKSFHRFPSENNNGIKRLQWIAKLRVGKKVSNRMVVCNRHFKDSDYFPRAPGIKVNKWKLKRTAVPSLNLPISGDTDQIKTNKKLKYKQQLALYQESRLPLISVVERTNWNQDKYTGKLVDNPESATNSCAIVDSTTVVKEEPVSEELNIIRCSTIKNEQTVENVMVCRESPATSTPFIKATSCEITLNSKRKEQISKDLLYSDYSAYNFSLLDSKEILIKKLKTLITINGLLQKELNLYKGRCKIYEKDVTILKRVIEDLKLINSVTFDK